MEITIQPTWLEYMDNGRRSENNKGTHMLLIHVWVAVIESGGAAMTYEENVWLKLQQKTKIAMILLLLRFCERAVYIYSNQMKYSRKKSQ